MRLHPIPGAATFIGIDLGWYGKPSGLAAMVLDGKALYLRKSARLLSRNEICAWIEAEACDTTVAGVDAPLVIRNPVGIRPAERELNREFRRFHAGCHAANLGRPFADNVIAFSRDLERLGFTHGPAISPRQPGRFQVEVHPHAAIVSLFGLNRIVKYKRGTRAERAAELRRLRSLVISASENLDPPFAGALPVIPRKGSLKPAEDQIDAVLCAYIAAHWWFWGTARNRVFGNRETGYIVVPQPGITSKIPG